ncbi:MAG: TIGR00730 family Rossman fold protein [Alphaproteobacteria bacterium]|nr:TIGR00730 family Rossman fold protein [Alphaproteobacteria bacterium]
MTKLTSVCVFCGSRPGNNPEYMKKAREFGKALADNDIILVYGGGSNGLMGAVAKGTFENGGYVKGIIPKHLADRELEYNDIQELEVVTDMHTRKHRMFELSDAICVFPGGFGTMDEIFEILTWRQLGLHNMPVAMANIEGYYENWKKFVHESIMGEGFSYPGDESLFQVVDDINDILPVLQKEFLSTERIRNHPALPSAKV